MKKLTLTIVTTYKVDKDNVSTGDEFPSIVAIGYNEEEAKNEAFKALQYACCKDFSDNKTFLEGYAAEYCEADAFELETEKDEEGH